MNAWNENGQIDDEDYSVLVVKATYDEKGLEIKKLLNIELGWGMVLKMSKPVDSASTVNFIQQNSLHELKLRYPNLKIYPVTKRMIVLCCGFTDDKIHNQRQWMKH